MAVEGLTDQQLAQLIGYDLCYVHSHPKEILGFSERLELMAAQPPNTIISDYTLTKSDDLILVDTSIGDVTITLPLASQSREFQIVKYSDLNRLFIVPTSPDLVLGSASGIQVNNKYSSLHIKAIVGEYILV